VLLLPFLYSLMPFATRPDSDGHPFCSSARTSGGAEP
jgi:hypothetical protein